MTIFQNKSRYGSRNQNNYKQSHLRSNSSLGGKRNYNTFAEDPQKAVFLSGFKTNLHPADAKDYREMIYQELQKHGVYIKKLDLPVNSKFGYLHTKTVEQAQRLLNLRNVEDSESGKMLSQLDLGKNNRNWRTKVLVYEYERKTDNQFDDNSSMRSGYLNVNNVRERGRNGRNYTNSMNSGCSYGTDSYRSQSQNYSDTRSRNGNSSNGFMSSRSISPENAPSNLDSGRNPPFPTPMISDDITIAPVTTNSNSTTISEKICYNSNSNFKDSALQSQIITEPTSEDELDANQMLKDRTKSCSTKTVVPAESKLEEIDDNDEQMINYESETEMNISDNENNNQKTNDAILQRQSSQGVNNVDEIINHTTSQLIYEGLRQVWNESYNLLNDDMQQLLMLNYHDAFFNQGPEQAANRLNIEGSLALSLLLNQTL